MRRIVLALVGCVLALAPAARAEGVVGTSLAGSWREIGPSGWDGSEIAVAVDRAAPRLVYAVASAPVEWTELPTPRTPCGKVARSTDSGATWTALSGACGVVPDGRRARRVYGWDGVTWRVSDDAGETWRMLPWRFPRGDRLVQLVPAGAHGLAGIVERGDPLDDSTLRTLWRTDDGVRWRRVGRRSSFGQVIADPTSQRRLYVTVGASFYATGRVALVDVEGRVRVRAAIRADAGSCRILADPRRRGHLFCGPFESLDGGRRWTYGDGSAAVGIDPGGDRVYLGRCAACQIGATGWIARPLLVRAARGGRSTLDGRGLVPLTEPRGVVVASGAELLASQGAVWRRGRDDRAWSVTAGPYRAVVRSAAAAAGVIAVGTLGEGVQLSSDVGETWRRVGALAEPDSVDVAPASGSPPALLVGSHVLAFAFGEIHSVLGALRASADGGRSWSWSSAAWAPVAFAQGSRLDAVAGSDAPGTLVPARSRDGGRTWRTQGGSHYGNPVGFAVPAGRGRFWVEWHLENESSEHDELTRTRLRGRGYEPAREEAREAGAVTLVAGEPGGAYAAFEGDLDGTPGMTGVARTRDGGATWERVLETRDRPGAVAAAGRDVVVTCATLPGDPEGAPARLLRSADAGASWRPLVGAPDCEDARLLPLADGRVAVATGARLRDVFEPPVGGGLWLFTPAPGSASAPHPLAGRDVSHALG